MLIKYIYICQEKNSKVCCFLAAYIWGFGAFAFPSLLHRSGYCPAWMHCSLLSEPPGKISRGTLLCAWISTSKGRQIWVSCWSELNSSQKLVTLVARSRRPWETYQEPNSGDCGSCRSHTLGGLRTARGSTLSSWRRIPGLWLTRALLP